jgi:hypothetical protein
MNDRPYTPERLAERWDCTPELVRRLLVSGALKGFRLGGKLWRIPVKEVEIFECQLIIASEGSTEDGLPSGTRTDAAGDGRLQQRARLMRERRSGSSARNAIDLRSQQGE